METSLENKVEKLSENVATLVTEMRFYRPMIEGQITTLTSVENRLTRMEERAMNNSEKISANDKIVQKQIEDFEARYNADKGAFRWAVTTIIALFLGGAGWLTYITNNLMNK